jgi:hypothetical protein
MAHYWLTDEHQVIMADAVSSAATYPRIFWGDFPRYWKREFKTLQVKSVTDESIVRTSELMDSSHAIDLVNGEIISVRGTAFIRLTAADAMMLRMYQAKDQRLVTYDDPTGETWGNILIAQATVNSLAKWSHAVWNVRRNCHHVANFATGRGFGPKVSDSKAISQYLKAQNSCAIVQKKRADIKAAEDEASKDLLDFLYG